MIWGTSWLRVKLNYVSMLKDFPGGPVVKNLPVNARDMGSIPGLERLYIPWGN